MLGTHMIFDELSCVLLNLNNWLKPGGVMLIVGAFNPNQYSTWVNIVM